VKASGAIRTRQDGVLAFAPAVVLFIALPETERQDRPGVTSIPLELLPRRCPFCGERTIIGYGQRLKQGEKYT